MKFLCIVTELNLPPAGGGGGGAIDKGMIILKIRESGQGSCERCGSGMGEVWELRDMVEDV